MSRLDFCQYELVDDCYDWKNDNCDECNIFKAYCEGARRAKKSIVRCKDCRYRNGKVNRKGFEVCDATGMDITDNDYCSYGERKE